MKKIYKYVMIATLVIYLSAHLITMSPLSRLDLFYAFVIVIGLLTLLLSNWIRAQVLNTLSINVAFITVFVILLELGFFFQLFSHVAITPISVKGYLDKKVQTLNSSPWFKFSPNTKITSVGTRGTDFVYSWTTDSLGYKNADTLSRNAKYDFLALGDSFTEGMGVSTEDTWPSLVGSIMNKRVYNSGVQGYAASQFLGTLKYLQEKIEFDGVIIGHLPTIYSRERNYISRPLNATGGIESIRLDSLGRGLVLPQILKIARTKFSSQQTRGDVAVRDDLNKYSSEVPDLSRIDNKTKLKDDIFWRELVDSYKQIAIYCLENKKRLVLVAFPHRYEIYFSFASIGLRSVHETQYYVEFDLLKEELADFGVTFVDTFPHFLEHTKAKSQPFLPYLVKDGHLSAYGNRIVAETLRGKL